MKTETRMRAFWLRGMAVAVCCVVSLCLASCGAVTATGQGTVRAGDAQNGRSITLHPGQTLIVTLPTTYWTIRGSSDAQALAPTGDPVASPASVDSCHFGGCTAIGGTTSQTFRAVAPGTATVTASRVTCGEAMGCVGASGQYQLTVEVTAATK